MTDGLPVSAPLLLLGLACAPEGEGEDTASVGDAAALEPCLDHLDPWVATDPAACPAFSGFGSEGAVRRYVPDGEESEIAAGEARVTTVQVGSTTVLAVLRWMRLVDGSETTVTGCEVFSCDASGTARLASEYRMTWSGLEEDGLLWVRRTYSDSRLEMVHDLAPGVSWADDWSYDDIEEGSEPRHGGDTVSGTDRVTAGALVEVTVPAGTFEAVDVEIETLVSDYMTVGHLQIVEGVGSLTPGEFVFAGFE